MENCRPENLLRKSTLTNAVFSMLSGVLIIVLNHPIVAYFGMPPRVSLTGLGMSLMVFAVFLLLKKMTGRRRPCGFGSSGHLRHGVLVCSAGFSRWPRQTA